MLGWKSRAGWEEDEVELDVNWLAVLVATVAHQALGALRYGVSFRNTWLRTMGMTPEEIEAAEEPGAERPVRRVLHDRVDDRRRHPRRVAVT